jgi:hypothetical protein
MDSSNEIALSIAVLLAFLNKVSSASILSMVCDNWSVVVKPNPYLPWSSMSVQTPPSS